MGDLTRRLKRDLQRSPKKAAILGILVLVAMWFWAPLVKKWFAGGAASQVQAAGVTADSARETAGSGTLTATPQPAAAGAEQTTNTTSHTWKQLVTWMEAEELAKTGTLSEPLVNPFDRGTQQQQPAEAVEQREQQFRPADVDPRSLGLVLTSTVVSPTSRLASINGHVFEIGASIKVAPCGSAASDPDTLAIEAAMPVIGSHRRQADDDSSIASPQAGAPIIEFRLQEIQPTYVVLSRGGQLHRLELKRNKAAGHDRTIVIGGQRPDG
jgi:hypothetical protein